MTMPVPQGPYEPVVYAAHGVYAAQLANINGLSGDIQQRIAITAAAARVGDAGELIWFDTALPKYNVWVSTLPPVLRVPLPPLNPAPDYHIRGEGFRDGELVGYPPQDLRMATWLHREGFWLTYVSQEPGSGIGSLMYCMPYTVANPMELPFYETYLRCARLL